MIKLGKVYSNLMVDMKPENEKLVQRAINIIIEISGASAEEAAAALQQYGSAKAAIFSLLSGLQGDDVYQTLDEYDGHLKNALKAASD